MKNHTLMQTIARANRRAEGKTSGVIVDYVGVFQNLQKALAIYAGGGGKETPIKDKEALVAALEDALTLARAFVQPLGAEPDAIMTVRDFERLRLISQAVEILIAPDERRCEFLRLRMGCRFSSSQGMDGLLGPMTSRPSSSVLRRRVPGWSMNSASEQVSGSETFSSFSGTIFVMMRLTSPNGKPESLCGSL